MELLILLVIVLLLIGLASLYLVLSNRKRIKALEDTIESLINRISQ
jgi:CHASE1-domain containing sensor protein